MATWHPGTGNWADSPPSAQGPTPGPPRARNTRMEARPRPAPPAGSHAPSHSIASTLTAQETLQSCTGTPKNCTGMFLLSWRQSHTLRALHRQQANAQPGKSEVTCRNTNRPPPDLPAARHPFTSRIPSRKTQNSPSCASQATTHGSSPLTLCPPLVPPQFPPPQGHNRPVNNFWAPHPAWFVFCTRLALAELWQLQLPPNCM